MPSVFRPDDADWTPEVELAVSVLGNRAKLAILRFLRDNDASRFGDIMAATGVKESSLVRHLGDLLDAGVLTSDVPSGVRAHRRYSVMPERIAALIDAWEEFALGDEFHR